MRRLLTLGLFLCLSLWLGSTVYFTAFAANELFAGLPVDLAGKAVGLLFPTFFTLCTALSAVTVVLYAGLATQCAARRSFWWGWLWPWIGVVTAAINEFGLLPAVQSIEAKMGPISTATPSMLQSFGMLHGISMLLAIVNGATAVLTWIVLSLHIRWMERT